jgi:hypothetical protein
VCICLAHCCVGIRVFLEHVVFLLRIAGVRKNSM